MALGTPDLNSTPAGVLIFSCHRDKREEYDEIVRKQVEDSKKVANREGVYVPTTVEEYNYKAPEPEPIQDYETSDDEKYVVQLDEDSEVEDGSASDSDTGCSDDEDTICEDEDSPTKKAGSVGSKRSAESEPEC